MTTGKATNFFMFFHRLNIVLITIACLLFLSFCGAVVLMSFAEDPLSLKMKLLTPTVNFNNDFAVEFDIERYEICKTSTDFFIFDAAGTKVTFPQLNVNAVGVLGKEKTTRKIKITKDMLGQTIVPGPARYRLALTWQCPGNIYQKYVSPKTHIYKDIQFEIVGRED